MNISPKIRTVSILLVFFQFFTIGLLVLREPIFSSGILLLIQFAGIAVGLAGVWTLKLGKFNIEPIPKEEAILQTTDIYNYIRHPMYASIFLFFSPALFNMTEVMSFAIFGLLVITLLIKLHFEEYLLSQKFKNYAEYQARSKKLIPFIF